MSVIYPGSELLDKIRDIHHDTHHIGHIFPEDTDETVTVTAGGTNNVFGAWVELVDNNPVTLSSKFAAGDGHISAILVEETSRTDERYLLELSYGASKTIIGRSRFMKTTVFMDVSHQTRITTAHIPVGETIYYRLKCETANGTAQLQLRYYLI